MLVVHLERVGTANGTWEIRPEGVVTQWYTWQAYENTQRSVPNWNRPKRTKLSGGIRCASPCPPALLSSVKVA